MTVTQLREVLQELETEGKGELKVIWDAISHSYDAVPVETTRNGIPVILING